MARQFDEDLSWQLIGEQSRQWALEVAGAQIRDPHNGELRHFRLCDVQPADRGGPASFRLALFGKGGLAVATATSTSFAARPDATRWRVARTTLPIDPDSVRSSHLRQAASNTARIDHSTSGGSSQRSEIKRYVPDAIADDFGNLPVETQFFLTRPFIDAGKPPQAGHLDAALTTVGYGVQERYICYLYSGRNVAVVEAKRVVARASGAVRQQLWNSSVERRLLEAEPWTVSAYVAPVARPPAAGLASRS